MQTKCKINLKKNKIEQKRKKSNPKKLKYFITKKNIKIKSMNL